MNFEQAFQLRPPFKAAFLAFRRAPFALWVSSLAMFLVNPIWVVLVGQYLLGLAVMPADAMGNASMGPVSPGAFADVAPEQQPFMTFLAGLCCLGFSGLTLVLARSYLHAGYIRFLTHLLSEGTPDYRLLKAGGDRFAPMLVWKLLWIAIMSVVFLGIAVPIAIVASVMGETTVAGVVVATVAPYIGLACATVVWLGLVFGEHLITLERREPIGALKRSWAMSKGYRLRFALFMAVCVALTLVGYLGAFIFCVGALVTVPLTRAIADLAFTKAYLDQASTDEEQTGRIEAASLTDDEIPSIPSV